MNHHCTTNKKLPRQCVQTTADIDQSIAHLIEHLWRLGFVTRYCCEGDGDDDGRDDGNTMRSAYIAFGSWADAALFASWAGPLSWDRKTHRQRHAENPHGTERWTWDWKIDGPVVRFPTRDIPRVIIQLSQARWRLDRVGALLARRSPPPNAPAELASDPVVRIGALESQSDAHQSAPKLCPLCESPVLSRRRDARYCSRRCQLRARDRSRRAPNGAEK
jgi:hypothetical protein